MMIPVELTILAVCVAALSGVFVGRVAEVSQSQSSLKGSLVEVERELILFQAAILLATAVPNFEMFNGHEIIDPEVRDVRRQMAESLFRMSQPVRDYVPKAGDAVALDAVTAVITKIEEIMLMTSGASVH